MQAMLAIPSIAARHELRQHAAAIMLADCKRNRPKSHAAKSIVVLRKKRPNQWFECLNCGVAGSTFSSSTSPPPLYAQRWRTDHIAFCADMWLAMNDYVVPGSDPEVDTVLGDTLVEAFGRLTVVQP